MNGEHKIGSGAAPRPLLKESDFRALLGGMSERKFKELRAAGIVPEPLELAPRVSRWTYGDYLETVERLPRRQRVPEPELLAKGRRTRIERIKAGGSAAAAA